MYTSPEIEAFKKMLKAQHLSVKDIAQKIGVSTDAFRQSLYRGTLQEESFAKLAEITSFPEEKLRSLFSVSRPCRTRGTPKDERNILPLMRTVASATEQNATLSLHQFKKLLQVEEEWGSSLSVETIRGLLQASG